MRMNSPILFTERINIKKYLPIYVDINRISHGYLYIYIATIYFRTMEILICLAGLTAVIQRALTPPLYIHIPQKYPENE